MALNNPAARLHNILKLCKSLANEMGGKPMVQAWRKVFSLDDDVEDIVVMSKVGRVYGLPSQISDEIKQFEDLDHTLYLGWKNDLAQAFQAISFTNAFSGFTNKLSDSLLINIQFCAHELSKRCPEKIVDDAQLAELKEAVYTLYQEVQKANLATELSRYLLDHLYLMIEAIDNYLITGARALQNSIDNIVGTVITNQKVATAVKDSPVGNKFWGVVGKAAVLLQISKTAMELGEGAFKLLSE